MNSLTAIHKSVRDALYGWNYSEGDIVHAVDISYAIYCAVCNRAYIKPHITCLCLSGNLEDMGDGLYGINEEPTQ